MEIYRLVIKDKNEGIYRYGTAKTRKLKKLILEMRNQHGADSHPNPSDDELYRTDKHFCGVVGLEGLKKWFGDFLPKFASSREVYVMKLKAKEPLPLGRQSGTQVTFKWNEVEILEEKRLKYLDID